MGLESSAVETAHQTQMLRTLSLALAGSRWLSLALAGSRWLSLALAGSRLSKRSTS